MLGLHVSLYIYDSKTYLLDHRLHYNAIFRKCNFAAYIVGLWLETRTYGFNRKNRKKPQLDNKNRSLENKYLQPVHGINRLFSGILKYST